MLAGVKLVLSFLAALAVLLMPFGMAEPGAAMAATHDAAMAHTEHCAEQPEPGKKQPPESCCVTPCSALPAEPAVRASIAAPAPAHPAAAPADLHGLSVEAATPPPRSLLSF
jgi:hypothetical protein